MFWQLSLRSTLLCLVSLSSAMLSESVYDYGTSESTTDNTQATPGDAVTEPVLLQYYKPKYIEPCYVEKSIAAELLVQLNKTVYYLNRNDKYMQCHEEFRIVKVPSEHFKLCSADKLKQIQHDLDELTSRLLQHATRLQEPSEVEIFNLDREKFELIDELKALQIFYGPSPCDESTIVLYPFGPLVEYVEYNLNGMIALIRNARPTRMTHPTTARPTAAPTTKIPTIDDLLNSSKIFSNFSDQLTSWNRQSMSFVVHSLVSKSYAGNAANFNDAVRFIQGLPTIESRIAGYDALHKVIYQSTPQLDKDQLTKLLQQVQVLQKNAADTNGSLEYSVYLKMTELTEILKLQVNIGYRANCDLTNVAYQPKRFTAKSGHSSVYLHSAPDHKWRIYPRNKTGSPTFRIRPVGSGFSDVLYARDQNDSTLSNYQTKSSERYALRKEPSVDGESYWQFIPVPNSPDTFQIMTKNSDRLFAHSSAMGSGDFSGWRRVLLLKKGFTSPDLIPGADHWTLKCSPGEYETHDV